MDYAQQGYTQKDLYFEFIWWLLKKCKKIKMEGSDTILK